MVRRHVLIATEQGYRVFPTPQTADLVLEKLFAEVVPQHRLRIETPRSLKMVGHEMAARPRITMQLIGITEKLL